MDVVVVGSGISGLTSALRLQQAGASVAVATADAVLGGTFEPGHHDPVPAESTARAIVERCTRLVPELRGTRMLGQLVGLRPARHGGARVETEDGRLVHNYGHGGAGMTLSWGCADEVARLTLAGVHRSERAAARASSSVDSPSRR